MSNIPAQTQASALLLIKSALPKRVMDLLANKEGEGILAAIAKVTELLSTRWKRLYDDRYFLKSSRGSQATLTADVTHAAATYDHALAEGQVVLETRWGVQYVLSEQLTLGKGGGVASVQLRSLYRTHEANIEQSHLDAWPATLTEGVDPAAEILWGETSPAMTDAAKQEFLDGVDAETITIAATSDATGGRLPMLDLLAQGQGIIPGEDESAAQLADRLRKPVAVHSPDAILDAVNDQLAPFGVVATLEEPWTFAMTWGGLDLGNGSGAWGVAPWGRRGYFIVHVPDFGFLPDGFAFGVSPWGVHPWGTGDVSYEAFVDGLQDLVDTLSLAGVKGFVVAEKVGI